MVRRVDGAVTVPEPDSMVKLVVEAAFEPKVLVPAPRKMTLLRALEPIKLPKDVGLLIL